MINKFKNIKICLFLMPNNINSNPELLKIFDDQCLIW